MKKTKDVNKMKTLLAELQEIEKARIVVGVVGAAANYQYDKHATLADVATFNEYGTRHIPARSFLRTAADKHSGEYSEMVKKGLGFLTIQGGALKLINRLGLKCVADVQRNIVSIRTPPNAEATILKKKSSNPLIDSGRLRQSITYLVRKQS